MSANGKLIEFLLTDKLKAKFFLIFEIISVYQLFWVKLFI